MDSYTREILHILGPYNFSRVRFGLGFNFQVMDLIIEKDGNFLENDVKTIFGEDELETETSLDRSSQLIKC